MIVYVNAKPSIPDALPALVMVGAPAARLLTVKMSVAVPLPLPLVAVRVMAYAPARSASPSKLR